MKKYLGLFLFLFVFTVAVSAQKVPKATLTATESTTAQAQLISEGIQLHDAKKYDEAIKKYEQVLKESPDNAVAIYEMASSYYAKGDKEKALELALKGAQYKARVLPRFYAMIANIWDDQGKAKEAVELYKDTIKLLESDKNLDGNLSMVYLNLGISYARQKLYAESREALKKSVENDFTFGSPNYFLSEIFYGTKYKVPALLAAARFLSLEINSARSKRAATIFLDIMKPAKPDDKGNYNIFINMDAPKDEGDFGMYELVLGIATVETEKTKGKTQQEIYAGAVDTFIVILSEDKKIKSTFVGKNYVPFMTEMKNKGYSKTFAYLVLQQNGDKDAEKWLLDNEQKLKEFLSWAKTYKP